MLHSKQLDQAPTPEDWLLRSMPTIRYDYKTMQPCGIDWSGEGCQSLFTPKEMYMLMEMAKMDPVFLGADQKMYQAFQTKKRKTKPDTVYQLCPRWGADTSHQPYFFSPLPAVLTSFNDEEIPVLFVVDNPPLDEVVRNCLGGMMPSNVLQVIRAYCADGSRDWGKQYQDLIHDKKQDQAFQYLACVYKTDKVAVCILHQDRFTVWMLKTGCEASAQLDHVLTQIRDWAQEHLFWVYSPSSSGGKSSKNKLERLMEEHQVTFKQGAPES